MKDQTDAELFVENLSEKSARKTMKISMLSC